MEDRDQGSKDTKAKEEESEESIRVALGIVHEDGGRRWTLKVLNTAWHLGGGL